MTGPYAAAQVWKLDLFPGFGRELLEYLGDPTPFVPEEWLRAYRRIGRFAIPSNMAMDAGYASFLILAEEVRGTGVHVHARTRAHLDGTVLAIPRTGTSLGYWNVKYVTASCNEFKLEWHDRHGWDWPYMLVNNRVRVHPEFHRLEPLARRANGQWHATNDSRISRLPRGLRDARPAHWAMEGRARDEMGRSLSDSD